LNHDPPDRTQVAIVGGGPAGALLSHILDAHGIDSVVLELRSREYVLGRIRAGVLEQGSADLLRRYGLGKRMDAEGLRHDGVNLAFGGRLFRVDFAERVGGAVMIYGQTEVQKDLYDARDDSGGKLVFDVEDVALHDFDTDHPYVTYGRGGERRILHCQFVAGCDGSHGVCSSYLPADRVRTYETVYPFGWLGVLSETPPLNDELIYANHERGFALCSMRNPELSRYYVQCPLDDDLRDWPDERFWDELSRRLPPDVAASLVRGPSIEKSIAPLASIVREPMQHGRLFLAGDAAHVMPPTGAKGLNLAVSDVFHLSSALSEYYENGSSAGLEGYTQRALGRVWKAIRFSWWMTKLMHRFPDEGDFNQKIQEAELDYLSSSVAAQTAMAENYVGLPF
jgi:p-hydroxybenzoate 3-monooxygenase